MGEELFGEAPWQRAKSRIPQGSDYDLANPYPLRPRRRGNHYPQYTKKFSLGNGPLEYVQEYLITKEGGKMLGTLVALAVARMRNLETFVWDMPTGVLRDVWLALSSLADREDGQDCRLERVWIRWHDNSQLDMMNAVPPPPTLPINNIAPLNGGHASGIANGQPAVAQASQFPAVPQAWDRVEHPTFSVLPALKSLSVLDIDELPYLDEMSILIARSQHRLRELRVGVAVQAEDREWAQVWEGEALQQVDHTAIGASHPKINNSRLGGILGILVGRVYNMRNNSNTVKSSTSAARHSDEIRPLRPSMTSIDGMVQSSFASESTANLPNAQLSPGTASSSSDVFIDALSQQQPESSHSAEAHEGSSSSQGEPTPKTTPVQYPSTPTQKAIPLRTLRSPREMRLRGPYLDGKLKLDVLELERVPLSVPILQRAIDWTILTSLTLLNCHNHDVLWKVLRHTYTPEKPPKSQASPLRDDSPYPTPRRLSTSRCTDFALNLKKIHTNTASQSLINFIKDALAPNSLEVFFLQETRVPASQGLSIETIHRGVLRRHRGSLKKLMIDSSDPRGSTDYSTTNARWRRWMLNREILTFITSGRMPALRELGFTVDYKDWVNALQCGLSRYRYYKANIHCSISSSSAFLRSRTSVLSTSRMLPTIPMAQIPTLASLRFRSSTSSRCGPISSSVMSALRTSASRFWRTRRTTTIRATTLPTLRTLLTATKPFPATSPTNRSSSRTTTKIRTRREKMRRRKTIWVWVVYKPSTTRSPRARAKTRFKNPTTTSSVVMRKKKQWSRTKDRN